MSPENTRTGKVLESIVIPAVASHYIYEKQVCVGQKPDGSPYVADLLLRTRPPDDTRRILVSLKWQQVPGTAEQKVPFEVITLIRLLRDKRIDAAYLVLGGNGWRPELKRFYLSGELSLYITDARLVRIVDLNDFIALVNRQDLQ